MPLGIGQELQLLWMVNVKSRSSACSIWSGTDYHYILPTELSYVMPKLWADDGLTVLVRLGLG